MENSSRGEVTELLQGWKDQTVRDRLLALIYEELKHIAKNRLRSERPNHTLQPTALVHEAYLKLVDQKKATWQNRAQFLALAARKMRQILVDHARARHSKKRNFSGRVTVEVDELGAVQETFDVLDLHQKLEEFAVMDKRKAQAIECRFFAGMTARETAEVLSVSKATVDKDLRTAKAWLKSELVPPENPDSHYSAGP